MEALTVSPFSVSNKIITNTGSIAMDNGRCQYRGWVKSPDHNNKSALEVRVIVAEVLEIFVARHCLTEDEGLM